MYFYCFYCQPKNLHVTFIFCCFFHKKHYGLYFRFHLIIRFLEVLLICVAFFQSLKRKMEVLVYLLCTIKQYYTALAIPDQKLKKKKERAHRGRKSK